MNSRIPYFVSLPLAVLCVTGFWIHEHTRSAQLRAELAQARERAAALGRLERERDHLVSELLAARRDAVPPAAVPAPVTAAPAPGALIAAHLGEWTPAAAWRQEGRQSPRAVLSTALAAAAAGNVRALQETLEFGDAIRERGRQLYAGLKPEARLLFQSPEELVAAVTMKNIPRTAAQVVWLLETDADHGAAGLMLAAPASPPSSRGSSAPAPATHQLAFLTLHRTGVEWRIVVPDAALERVRQELVAGIN